MSANNELIIEENWEEEAQEQHKEVGENCRSMRLSKRLTQGDIAKALGCSITTISNFERGLIISRPKLIENAYRMFIIDKWMESLADDFRKTPRVSEFNLKEEIKLLKEKCEYLTQFITDRHLVEQYNLTIMDNEWGMFKELSIPVGQHELETMQQLVDQYNEVKSRLTTLCEMGGNNEIGGKLSDLYGQTGLAY